MKFNRSFTVWSEFVRVETSEKHSPLTVHLLTRSGGFDCFRKHFYFPLFTLLSTTFTQFKNKLFIAAAQLLIQVGKIGKVVLSCASVCDSPHIHGVEIKFQKFLYAVKSVSNVRGKNRSVRKKRHLEVFLK